MAWLDGKLVDWIGVNVSPLSHSFSRASAVFDVMAVVPAVKGPALICLKEHVERFFSSAERTGMTIPFTPDEICKAIIEVARANSVHHGIAKFYAYYPEMDLGSKLPEKVSTTIFCVDYSTLGSDPSGFSAPISVGISQYRKLHPQTAAVHAKVVGNYVNGYLARTEVRRKGFDEALMLDTAGYVAEGPTSNIFLVSKGCVETPTKENVLPGITRRVVIDVLTEMGHTVKETHILPQNLCEYDEAFFSGTLRQVQPIRQIEGCSLSCPGAITQALMSRMQEVYSGSVKRYENILSYVDES